MSSSSEGGAAGDDAVARSLRFLLDRICHSHNSSRAGGAAAEKRARSGLLRAVAAAPEAPLPAGTLDELQQALERMLAQRVPNHRFEFVLEFLVDLVDTQNSARHQQVGTCGSLSKRACVPLYYFAAGGRGGADMQSSPCHDGGLAALACG
ncbi:hypothetical protein MNEG_7367 [Monoraphidium neglectum]|jgi:hypothetical protein|uniref:Uncharacterized protein n=1 Tax=Monoraphidium neglectum TaxID=145388 RepID=A0A0D2JN53_9CHLO|nr:hypothetical protein MNEG_7367 [Monoraphidium neglectum]KIZ00593.1 hypothetical protein MNEG_7367 [Monoraphidium neglectum]|eukprot:XP_013899612.1 hypothetical protein MNEG_7367 [Monoraphidium neglectum]